jgi:hypothetical protein
MRPAAPVTTSRKSLIPSPFIDFAARDAPFGEAAQRATPQSIQAGRRLEKPAETAIDGAK